MTSWTFESFHGRHILIWVSAETACRLKSDMEIYHQDSEQVSAWTRSLCVSACSCSLL